MSLVLLLALAGLTSAAAGQEEADVKAVAVRDGVHMLMGKGGNIGVFIGPEGTFLIDDQYAPLTDKILAAIRALGGDTPRFLINTHYHADHTGGNENLGKAGTLIFSQDQVRERLTVETVLKAFKMVTPPQPKSALPVVTYSTDITFHLNGDTLHAIHVPRAHTDGDSVIHFKKANVIHTGDILFNGFYPFIDVDHGGTLKGMIAAADSLLALADADTKLIPGHGPLGTKTDLAEYRTVLATAYERLRKLRAQGMDADAAAASKPLADLEERWGKGLFTGEQWVRLVYGGLD